MPFSTFWNPPPKKQTNKKKTIEEQKVRGVMEEEPVQSGHTNTHSASKMSTISAKKKMFF